MHGVSIRSIKRAGISIPVLAQTVVDAGDVIEVVGTRQEVEAAAKRLGYIDRPTNQTDMIFVGLGTLSEVCSEHFPSISAASPSA